MSCNAATEQAAPVDLGSSPDWTLTTADGTLGLIMVDRDMTNHFNLLKLPQLDLPNTGAAFVAPYWAAELRKALK
jgi:hypothetical protein